MLGRILFILMVVVSLARAEAPSITNEPTLNQFLQGAAAVTRKVVSAKDGKVEIAVADTMDPYTKVTHVGPGHRLVSISLGELKACPSDDYLAFAIRRALEEDTADLKKTVADLRAKGETDQANAKERAIIQEASVKATEKILEAGFNPNAVVAALKEKRSTFGENNDKQQAVSSQIDLVGATIAKLQLDGKHIPRDDPALFKKEVIAPVRQNFFDNGSFKARQLSQIDTFIQGISGRKQRAYLAAKEAYELIAVMPEDVSESTVSNIFTEASNTELEEIQTWGRGILTETEMVNIATRIYAETDAAFELARSEEIPANFKLTHQNQIAALRAIDTREYPTGDVDLLLAAKRRVDNAESRLTELNAELAAGEARDKDYNKYKLEGEVLERHQRTIEAQKQAIKQAETDLQTFLTAYQPGALEKLKQYDQHDVMARFNIKSARQQEEHDRKEKRQELELSKLARVVGPLVVRNRERDNALVENNLEHFLGDKKDPGGFNYDIYALRRLEESKFQGDKMEHYPEFDKNAPGIFKAYIRSSRRYLQQAKAKGGETSEYALSYITRWGGDAGEGMQQVFNRYYELNPEAAKADMRELLGLLFENATSVADHQNAVRTLFFEEHSPSGTRFRSPHIEPHNWGGFSLNAEFSRELFTPEFREKYRTTLNRAVTHDIKNAPDLGTIGSAVINLQRLMDRMEEVGVAGNERKVTPQEIESARQMEAAMIERVKTIASQGAKSPLTASQAKSLAYAIAPSFHDIAKRAGNKPPDLNRLKTDLQAMAKSAPMVRIIGRQINPHALRRMLYPDGPSVKSHEFIYSLTPLLGHSRDSHQLSIGLSQGDVLRERTAYITWLQEKHPEQGRLIGSIITPSDLVGDNTVPKALIKSDAESEAFKQTIRDLVRNRFEYYLGKGSPTLTERERIANATTKTWLDLGQWVSDWGVGEALTKLIDDKAGQDPQKRLEFWIAYEDGLWPWMKVSFEQQKARAYHRAKTTGSGVFDSDGTPFWSVNIGEKSGSDWVREILYDKPELWAGIDAAVLLDAFVTSTSGNHSGIGRTLGGKPSGSAEMDLLWEHLMERFGLRFKGQWEKLSGGERSRVIENFKKLPEAIRTKLMDRTMVGRLHYKENKKNLALVQIDQIHNLEAHAAHLKRTAFSGKTSGLPSEHSRLALPSRTETRIEISGIKSTLDLILPDKTAAKADVINYIEDVLITNRPETELLDEGKVRDWTEHDSVGAFDIVNHINKAIRDNADRYELLEFLLGVRKTIPNFMASQWANPDGTPNALLKAALRHFTDADHLTRGRILVALLDEEKGLLAEEAYREKIMNLILGDSRGNKFIREYAITKSKVLAERSGSILRMRLVQALASFPDSSDKRASLVTYLQSLRSYGKKAAQALASTGLVSGPERENLKQFYDDGQKPERIDEITYMEKAFGTHADAIVHFGPPIGAGSINSTQLLFVRIPADATTRVVNPKTGKTHVVPDPMAGKIAPVSFSRLQEGVQESAVAVSEEELETARRLKLNSDPEIRRMGEGMELVDSIVMKSIGPGGVELDKTHDRKDRWRDAVVSYTDLKPSEHSGLITVVARPIDPVQNMLGGEFQKPVSVWEFIPNERFIKMKEGDRKTGLAKHARTMESRAVRRGIVELDGHPGNILWAVGKQTVYDFDKKAWVELDVPGAAVRIDIAQTTHYGDKGPNVPLEKELATAKSAMKASVDTFGALLRLTPFGIGSWFQMRRIAGNFGKAFTIENPPPGGLKNLASVLTKIANSKDWPGITKPVDRLYYIREQVEREYQKQYPNLKVRLSQPLESAVSSAARSNAFAESIPLLDDLKILRTEMTDEGMWWHGIAKPCSQLMGGLIK